MAASLIEFYKRHKISPVRQDIRDLRRHFERREALYRHLGILPAFIKGRKVLEVGPGSGFNSLYTASLEPSSYVLVEGNPTGVEDIERLFSEYPNLKERIHIAPVLLSDYDSPDLFDFVLCEGVLSGVPDPEDTLRRVASFVTPGGVLVITCVDNISYFPDTLRRLCAHLLIDPDDTLDAQVAILMPIFSQHLSRLKGMSRRHDDWIIDNLINPASIGKLMSIPEAISVVADDFDVYATSPHFITDWRWYKAITGSNRNFNQIAIDQYWQNVHSLLDHSRVFPSRPEAMNRQIYDLCRTARDTIREFENSRDLQFLQDIQHILGQIIVLVESFSTEVANALREVQSLLAYYPIDRKALAESQKFGSLFGRGQQYLSLNRRLEFMTSEGSIERKKREEKHDGQIIQLQNQGDMPFTTSIAQNVRRKRRDLLLPQPSAGVDAYLRERELALVYSPARRENYERYLCSSRRSAKVDYLPIKLNIENVSRCNFRCTMCVVSDWPKGRRAKDMTLDEFKRLIDEQYGLVEITLNGLGEPLMQGDIFFEMIKYARSQHIWVRTSTNASLLHLKDNYKKLVDSDVNEIDISIDGANKETFEAIRRGSHFEKVIENCKLINAYCRQKGVGRTKMVTVVQRGNQHQVEDLIRLAHETGFASQVFTLELNSWGLEEWRVRNEMVNVEDSFSLERLLALVEEGERLGVKVWFWNVAEKYSTTSRDKLCPWPFERALVTSDLRTVPCCIISNPDAYELGKGRRFMEVWTGEEYAAFRQAHLDGNVPKLCQGCYYENEHYRTALLSDAGGSR